MCKYRRYSQVWSVLSVVLGPQRRSCVGGYWYEDAKGESVNYEGTAFGGSGVFTNNNR